MKENEHRLLAIIPARGGSKRLPRKNLVELNGKPLIAWTIDAAKNSRCVSDFCVSTEDQEIANVAKLYGASVPFARPQELATDTATSIDVALQALTCFEEWSQKEIGWVALLQPTSPLRTSHDIDNAFEVAQSKNADAVVSVCELDHPREWAAPLPDNHNLNTFFQNTIFSHHRSQDLPKNFRINGALYLVKTELFKKEKTFFPSKNAFAYVMPRERSIDIDTEWDLKIARAIMRM